MNYEKNEPKCQSPENEVIIQISQKLIHEFSPSSRIQIMKEVQQLIHNHLEVQLKEATQVRDEIKDNFIEFEKAFGLEKATVSKSY